MVSTSVADLLLADTPSTIASEYQTLAARAASVDFGPLTDGIVMLDTETTGLSFRDCELIEIAAARMEGGEVVDRFQTFVHPQEPIPANITALTNITNEDVANAPTAVEAVRNLAEFVQGMPIVAHNATFDRNFVEKVPGGTRVTDVWVDSLALSRIALPRLSSHRLADMAQAFGCDSVTHRAMDDVDALCGMWPIMMQGLKDLPAGVLDLLANMHEDVEWEYRDIFSYLGYSAGEETKLDLVKVRDGLVKQIKQPDNDDAQEREKLLCPSREEIDGDFCPGFTGNPAGG